MRPRLLILVTLLLAPTTNVHAQVDGRWSGSVLSPAGTIDMVFVFSTDGSRLNGTYSASDGNEADILDGTIDGDSLTFSMEIDLPAGTRTLTYRGTLLDEGRMDVRSQYDRVRFAFLLLRDDEELRE